MKKYVYLAGSINGHDSLETANGWREKATKELGKAGYGALNPLRGRKLTDENSKEIVERDLEDIQKADIILVEMSHENKAYIGTAIEIRYAWEQGKEIILWGRANRESHWLKYHAHAWFDTLEDAIKYLKRRAQ